MFYLTLLLVHLNFFYLSASPEGEENSVIKLSGEEAYIKNTVICIAAGVGDILA